MDVLKANTYMYFFLEEKFHTKAQEKYHKNPIINRLPAKTPCNVHCRRPGSLLFVA